MNELLFQSVLKVICVIVTDSLSFIVHILEISWLFTYFGFRIRNDFYVYSQNLGRITCLIYGHFSHFVITVIIICCNGNLLFSVCYITFWG